MVAAGYYFQIIAVIYQPERPGALKPERDSRDMAREVAAWTSENIRWLCSRALVASHQPAVAMRFRKKIVT